ncbi:hypothetical protein [Streptomyces sp. NBC_00425]|uniref:hypothetical protein n=1 Tax=Streptomyces sp. NBC_00425 TaxID=2975740 RepID=UPI002E23F0E5
MSTEQQDDRTSGSPAHSFGNTLAWNWSREMPRYLKGPFLTALYACRALASASGRMCFKDGKAIRIQDMAKAFGCREQDARRYLDAAIRAGVILVDGERRRGIATVYVLNALIRHPDWKAAEDYLKATARRPKEEETPAKGSSHSGTNSSDGGSVHSGTNQFGPQRHELGSPDAEEVRATEARPGSDHSGTNGSVHRGTNNPGSNHELPHEMADVVTQPQPVAREVLESDRSSAEDGDGDEPPFGRCEVCRVPLTRPGRNRCAGHLEGMPGQRRAVGRRRPVQAPLMTVVPPVADSPAEASSEPFHWEPENPLDPERVCACGRTFRSRDGKTCQDCKHAAHQEARTA